jgi:hypothetical protein
VNGDGRGERREQRWRCGVAVWSERRIARLCGLVGKKRTSRAPPITSHSPQFWDSKAGAAAAAAARQPVQAATTQGRDGSAATGGDGAGTGLSRPPTVAAGREFWHRPLFCRVGAARCVGLRLFFCHFYLYAGRVQCFAWLVNTRFVTILLSVLCAAFI